MTEEQERWTHLANNILELIVQVDRAHHSGWGGVAAAQSNVVSAARYLITDEDLSRAQMVYEMAAGQFEAATKGRPLDLREQMECIAEELKGERPILAEELEVLAKKVTCE